MNKYYVSGVFIFIFGIFLGLSITRVPFLTLKSDIDIVSIGNLLLLIFCIFVPLFSGSSLKEWKMIECRKIC